MTALPLHLAATSPLQRVVGGALLIAFSGIWVALADVPPTTSAFFRCVYALPLLALIARRETPTASARARWMGALAGVCFTGDLVMWHASIDLVGAGLATVLGAGQVVVVPLVSWLLLRERPHRRVVVSLPVLVAGVVVISGVLGTGAYGTAPRLGALLGAGAGVSYAGFLLALRQANAGGLRPAGALRDATLGGTVGTLAASLLTGHGATLVPAWPSAGWLLALAIGSQVIAWLLITSSLPQLPGAVSSVVLTLQPMLSVALGIVLLGERPTLPQVLGMVMVMGAVTWATGLRPLGRLGRLGRPGRAGRPGRPGRPGRSGRAGRQRVPALADV